MRPLIYMLLTTAAMLMANPSLAFTDKPGTAAPGSFGDAWAVGSCREHVENASGYFAESVRRGLESGQLAAKDKAALEKTRIELQNLARNTTGNKKITRDACDKVVAKIAAQNDLIDKERGLKSNPITKVAPVTPANVAPAMPAQPAPAMSAEQQAAAKAYQQKLSVCFTHTDVNTCNSDRANECNWVMTLSRPVCATKAKAQ